MNDVVSMQREGSVAVVCVDNPPVNALSQAVRAGIVEAIAEAGNDPEVKAIVLICAGRTFMAGADITEFGKPPLPPGLPEMIDVLDQCPKLLVAAIHGTALGGGLETALGCHYRCALPTAQLGLPEVKLGILPGAGGTQRLPRLAGVANALEMMVSGNPVSAHVALERSIVDHLVEGDLKTGAVAYARSLLASGAQLRRIRDLAVDTDALPEGFFDQQAQVLAKTARGYFSPFRILQSVKNAVEMNFDAGMQAERDLFIECLNSPQSAALRHVFFAERQVGRIPGLDKQAPMRPIESVGIVGAGTMGGGIAMNFANVGIPVTLIEREQEALDRGLKIIHGNYERTMKKGKLSPEALEQRMGLISGSTDYAELAPADLVIEAVFENMALKKEVFGQLDKVCKHGAILASNTSTLDVDEIAAATGRPQDVLGMHFFSPANVMRLLEIVRGEKTSDEVLGTVVNLARTLRKVGVVSGVCFGFIGNRMLEGYAREVGLMLLEGAAPERIDAIVQGFGFPMGPNAMIDMAGLDVRAKVIGEAMELGILPPDDRYEAVTLRLAADGRHGQKTGAGIFRYEPGNRSPIPDPRVSELIAAEAVRLGVAQREHSNEEILDRCLLPLVNEGARILEEGIAFRPGDIDIVWLYGYGFPVFQGGPMHYADAIGLPNILASMKEFAGRDGDPHGYWSPSALLEKLAAEGGSFATWQG
ncbi:MAG: 3-hydroxyacyl-CoA dehydrogenase NAD-binding domain-containing protein [Gammaproteobacteria bacterium]|nr:3-hydroxyacyl-CoA dehydrogenase NAD-binding domain-containing protein [Gammaproteobacteria bacterium]